MRDTELLKLVALLGERVAVIGELGAPTLANLHDWNSDGYPEKGAGTSGGASGFSDPVVRAAMQKIDRGEDSAEKIRRELELFIVNANNLLAKAERIVVASTTTVPRPASNGCSVCGRARRPREHACDVDCEARDHFHRDGWQEIHRRLPALEHKGNGPAPLVPYCSWCADFVERYSVEPATTIVLFHLDHPGTKVPHGLIRDHHPVEFEAHRTRKAQPTLLATSPESKFAAGVCGVERPRCENDRP